MAKRTNDLEKAFLGHLEKSQAFLHKICLAYSNTVDKREDLYQEIILQLWRSYPTFKSDAKFSTWAYRVALNTALSLTRKPRFFSLPENTPEQSYSQEEELEMDEQLKVLYQAIQQLKKVDRAIVLLWLDEFKYEEIAEMTGISKKNVSVRLVRAKEELTKIIKKLI